MADINQGSIDFCAIRFSQNKKIAVHCNDGPSLEFMESSSHSSAFCYDEMVHFELDDVNLYLKELFRVLNNGGILTRFRSLPTWQFAPALKS